MVTQVIFDTISPAIQGFCGTAPMMWSATTDQNLSVITTPGAVSSYVTNLQLKPGDIVFVNYGVAGFPSSNGSGAILTVINTAGGTLASYPFGSTNDSYIEIPISTSDITGMYAAPKLLVSAPGNNLVLFPKQAILVINYGSVLFTGGGTSAIQFTNTANGVGYFASADIASALFTNFNSAPSYIVNVPCEFNSVLDGWTATQIANQGLYLSNKTAPFAAGNGNALLHLWYSVIPTS